MNKRPIKDLSASVSGRLKEIAREKGEDFQVTLARYGVERFLYRLSRTKYRDKLILKGAMSFRVWSNLEHRATRDADFLGIGEDSMERLRKLVEEIISAEVENDALVFDSSSIRISEIMKDDQYHGKRIILTALLGKIRIHLQLDIGFGDAVTPKAKIESFPPLLDLPEPQIYVYPRESVVAEKYEAIVSLGMANSRMKDYFDLLFISDSYQFNYKLLRKAVINTFQNRNTEIPVEIPLGLSDEFIEDTTMNQRWFAFLNKMGLKHQPDLSTAIDKLRLFLLPLLESEGHISRWPPGGPWTVF